MLIALLLFVAAPPSPPRIEDVSWLTGCWVMTDGDRVVEEQWMAPRGRTMIGTGRTVRGDRLVEYELVILREEGETLAYEAHPSGQATAVFTARDASSTKVVFENLQHDFPQRVGYERRGAGVVAWVEGMQGGRTRRIEFPYQRCS